MASGSDASMSEPSTSTGTTSGKENEVILKWRRDELKQALTDLVMHSFLEASSAEAPRVLPKEIAKLLKELDSLISTITNLCGFSVNLLPVMRQHSQRVDRINNARTDKRCYDPDCTTPVTAFVTYTGPAYKPRAFVLDPTVAEDERVYYCMGHHFIADRLYSLIHMRWNIMLNAQHRLAKKPGLMAELNSEASVVTMLPGQQANPNQPVHRFPVFPGPSTAELTNRFKKTCKQYLNELRFGTGQPEATYNTFIDTRLQLIGHTTRIKLPILQHSVISLDPFKNRLLLNGYPNGWVRLTNLCAWPRPVVERVINYGHPVVDFSWFKDEEANSFVTASADGYITVWDSDVLTPVETCKVSTSLTGISMHLGLYGLVAVALPRCVPLIDPRMGKITNQITWKDHDINVVQWHPRDPAFLFCGSTQGRGALFDIQDTRRPLREVIPGYGGNETHPLNKVLHPLAKAKFTTDGTKLVWLDKQNIMRVFKMEDGTEETVFQVRCSNHFNQARYHFDLIEEGSEYRAVVPYDNNMSIVSLSRNPPNRYYKHIETGFVGCVTGAKYRKEQQHIVAISTHDHCTIFKPSTDR